MNWWNGHMTFSWQGRNEAQDSLVTLKPIKHLMSDLREKKFSGDRYMHPSGQLKGLSWGLLAVGCVAMIVAGIILIHDIWKL